MRKSFNDKRRWNGALVALGEQVEYNLEYYRLYVKLDIHAKYTLGTETDCLVAYWP